MGIRTGDVYGGATRPAEGCGKRDFMASRYGQVALVDKQRNGQVFRIAEMSKTIYSLGTQVPPVRGQDSLSSLFGSHLRDTQMPEAFVSGNPHIVGEVTAMRGNGRTLALRARSLSMSPMKYSGQKGAS